MPNSYYTHTQIKKLIKKNKVNEKKKIFMHIYFKKI